MKNNKQKKKSKEQLDNSQNKLDNKQASYWNSLAESEQETINGLGSAGWPPRLPWPPGGGGYA